MLEPTECTMTHYQRYSTKLAGVVIPGYTNSASLTLFFQLDGLDYKPVVGVIKIMALSAWRLGRKGFLSRADAI